MIVAAQIQLCWPEYDTYDNSDRQKAMDTVKDWGVEWAVGDNGPELISPPWTGDDFYDNLIVSDLENLQAMGARGRVLFIDTNSEKRFISAVVLDDKILWYACESVQVTGGAVGPPKRSTH